MDADSSSAPKLDVTEERKRALAAQATDGSLAGNAPSFGFNDGGEAIFEADQASYTRAQSVLHEQKKREERDAFAQARQAASAATAPTPLAAPAAVLCGGDGALEAWARATASAPARCLRLSVQAMLRR